MIGSSRINYPWILTIHRVSDASFLSTWAWAWLSLTVKLQSEVLLILLVRKLWPMCFRCGDICCFLMPTNYIAGVSSVALYLTKCAIKLTISSTTMSSTSTISTTSSSSIGHHCWRFSKLKWIFILSWIRNMKEMCKKTLHWGNFLISQNLITNMIKIWVHGPKGQHHIQVRVLLGAPNIIAMHLALNVKRQKYPCVFLKMFLCTQLIQVDPHRF